MATSGTVVTLEEVVGTMPELRLKLEKKAKSVADQRPSDPNVVEKAKEYVEGLFRGARDGINLDERATQEAFEHNEQQLDAIFDKIELTIRKRRRKIKDEMRTLTLDGQKQVLTFWGSVQEFLNDVLNWLSNMFNYVLEKIRKGFKIVTNAIKGLFDTIYGFLGNIF